MTIEDSMNPWTPEEEGDHFPIMREWWTCEALFQTSQDHRRWNLMTSFAYEQETPSCFFQYVLFDITSKKWVLHKDINDEITKLSHMKNRLNLHYETSSLEGLYPRYHLRVEDQNQELKVDIDYIARSLPHWIAQETTQGNLPIGLNFYRYGFLPYFDIIGTMKLKKESYNIKGKGYLEHAWGDWSYQNPLQVLSGIPRTFSTYLHLTRWWLSNHRFKIPQRISFTSENNLFGYDWVWGVCENTWSLFFGNSLFWVSEGPSLGALYLTPDGQRYWEFCDVRFKYNKVLYVKDYDIYYPSDLELTGQLEDKTIHLRFWSTTDSYEYIDPHKKGRFYKAFILSELPGSMQGTFTDKERIIPLKGECKIVLLRQAPLLGHNAVNIELLLPPKGVALSIELDSHAFRKRLLKTLQLAPRPRINCRLKRIDLSQIQRESDLRTEP